MTSKPYTDEFFDNDLPSSNCADLIYWRAIVAGGRARDWACIRLLVKYEDQLRKKLQARHFPDYEVTELIQEIFIKLVNHCETFRYSEKKFSQWFLAIAQNTVTDYSREKQRREDSLNNHFEEQQEIAPLIASTKIHTIALQNCVNSSLDEFAKKYPKHAQILKQAAFEDLGHKELARMLNKEPGNAREFLSQCRKKFKPFVDHCKIYLDEDQL
jgi:RNA polymerase sigma factor (sigma-70 family)